MAKGKALTEEQIQEIAQQYLIKRRVAEVASSLGLSKTTVLTHLKRLDIFSVAKETNIVFATEQSKEIVDRYQNGESAKKIASSLDLSLSVVVKILTTLGILRKRSKAGYYNSLSSQDIEKIVQMYQQGMSSIKIAAEFNVSHDLICKHLHLLEIPIRKASFYTRCPLTLEQISEIYDRHKKGENICTLAVTYNTSPTTLKSFFKKENLVIFRKKNTISRKKLSADQEQQVIDLYQKGAVFSDIAQNFDVSEHTIRRIIKSHGISREKPIAGLKLDQVSKICHLYNQNISVHKLSQIYNVSDDSIKKLLISKGVF